MTSVSQPPAIPRPNESVSSQAPARAGRALLCLVLVAGCVTCADLLLKRGAMASHPFGSERISPLANLASIFTIAGIGFHLAGLAGWLYALRTIPLTIAYTFTAVQQATIALGAWLWLGEQISALRWGGILLVFVGVLVLVPEIAATGERNAEAQK